jgi:hypothetical protein
MFDRLKAMAARTAIVAASFVATVTLMLAVGAAFHAASSQPWLRDTPQARSAVARCAGRSDRETRQQCLQAVVAEARARDAGGARLAAAGASEWPRTEQLR